jgi:predicted ribosomally synthesized peptide with nif11-like leader
MSKAAAEAFFDRADSDPEFLTRLEDVQDDPNAVYAQVRAEGFDVEPEELMEVFTERYGVELSPEQLDAIAAGDDALIAGATIGGVLGLAASAAVLAACAA